MSDYLVTEHLNNMKKSAERYDKLKLLDENFSMQEKIRDLRKKNAELREKVLGLTSRCIQLEGKNEELINQLDSLCRAGKKD